ncbi:PKD domain-containing protein [Mucilaginibacter roseus]|uniref:PKD domain-containing protein n=1 Tax=Mucilaginibacter roseus TaxID=1528868 RepID=A0ABS8U009_9SPHI|nr:PKD domain-containing protein [Mucilaginibacter roseus]MCD8739587.1 PKD domain-containing protein [Mucilaginibacter roseus]
MKKIFTRLFPVLFFAVLFSRSASAQVITVSAVDPGPYGPGSTITARISVSGGCIVNPSNRFNLYLSDANGNFSGTGRLIGSFNDFYTTFVNGTIPSGIAAGSGYRLRVQSTSPSVTSTVSAPFSIGTAAGVPIDLSSITINSTKPEVFGQCENTSNSNTTYTITNETDASATVTAQITNEIDNTTQNLTLNAGYSAAAAHFTITAKGVLANGVVTTRSYMLVNNRVNLNAFRSTEVQTACLPQGTIAFDTDLSNGTSSLRRVFPGNIYTVAWGDGLSRDFTVCEILANNGEFSHSYDRSSCGNNIRVNSTTFYNSFGLTIRARNAYCSPGGALIAPIKVLGKANTDFAVRAANGGDAGLNVCTGTVTFINTSDPGDNPSNSSSTCKNPNARYNWFVNGTLIASNKTLGATDVRYNFTSPGNYKVRLVLISTSPCQTDPNDASNVIEKTICVQNPPTAAFNINGNTGNFTQCGNPSFTFRPTNTSTVDNSCVPVERTWSVSGPTDGYTINGSPSDNAPEITLTKPGRYTVRLILKGPGTCAPDTATSQITLSTTPVAQLKAGPIRICGSGTIQRQYSSDPDDDFYVNLSGTNPEVTGTYTWEATTVSGTGTVTFVDPVTAKYPRLRFSGPGEYQVTVTHKNDCNPTGVKSTHNIIIQNAPEITVSTPDVSNCPGDAVSIKGAVNGSYTSVRWESTGGGTFANANSLETTYTPSQAEIDAGTATVNLVVTTNLSAPCNTITTPLTIRITPPNTITSPLTLRACSNRRFSYTIEATLPGSTFQWEVDPTRTSATASGYPVSGTSSVIDGTIENTDPNGGAVTVTYIIRPVNSGCVGDARRLVITVIPSNPKIDFTATPQQACGPTTVTFTNNSPAENGTYQWDFGDGTTYTGQTPPAHTYQPSTTGAEASYEVSLRLVSDCQTFPPVTKTILVSPASPIPVLEATASAGCAGDKTITLVNRSPGNNQAYYYYLLDANKAIIQTIGPITDKSNQSFTVAADPNNTRQVFVRMRVVDKCGNETTSPDQPFTIVPSNLIASMFIQKSPPTACAGQDIVFVNNSTGDSFSYKIYKDGTLLEEIRNVPRGNYTYRFMDAGSYTVSVVAGTIACGPQGESAQQPITIYAIPNVTFNAAVENCDNNLNYTFTITGVTDANTRFSWDFGDGTPRSLEREPVHQYAQPGNYNVTLTVTNQLDCGNTVTRPIAVSPPLLADFSVAPGLEIEVPNFHFSFRDESDGNVVSWQWDFGDNIGTSNQRNPEYTYPQSQIGSHVVTLIITDSKGCTSEKRRTVTISGTPGTLFLPNAFIPSNSSAVLQTFMARGAGIAKWRMQIFNKWGQLVWETDKLGANGEPIEGWDGTYKGSPAPQGAYVWQVSATFINGTEWKGMSYGNSPPKRNGVINLIR